MAVVLLCEHPHVFVAAQVDACCGLLLHGNRIELAGFNAGAAERVLLEVNLCEILLILLHHADGVERTGFYAELAAHALILEYSDWIV